MFHVTILGSLFLLYTILVLWKRLQHLSHVPGPLICSLTDLYRAYQQNTRDINDFLAQQHHKYGPVVRVGPNTAKAESYNCLSTYVKGVVQGSVINIQDEAHSSHLKRAFGAAFAAKNVQGYEPLVDASNLALLDRLKRKGSVEIFDALRRFQIDFLLKAAFSEDKSVCKTDEDINGFTFHTQILHWSRWQSVQRLEYLIYKSSIVNKAWELFCTPIRPAWSVMTTGFLQGRLSHKTSSQDQQDLLDRWLDAQKKHSETIDIGTVRRMVASTVNAGFDATAYTMSMILYELLQNPSTLVSLQQELLSVQDAGLLSTPPKWTEVNKLPYLDAVMKEAMRMHPFLNLPLERVVPESGVELFGIYLPCGTVVGCSAGVTGKDTVCFGEDAIRFDPTRWLTIDESRRVAMERGSLGFGSGKRGCIGRHIAVLEMKKVVSALVQTFEMKFTYTGTTAESIDGITSFPKPIEMSFIERPGV